MSFRRPPPPRTSAEGAHRKTAERGCDRERRAGRSRLGRLILLILILAVVGGWRVRLVAAADGQRAHLVFDSGSRRQKPAQTTTAAPADARPRQPSTKDTDRLLPGAAADSRCAPATARRLPAAGAATMPTACRAPRPTRRPRRCGAAGDASADAGADAAPTRPRRRRPPTPPRTDDGAAATVAPQKATSTRSRSNAAGAANGVTAINADGHLELRAERARRARDRRQSPGSRAQR